ncbi:MAG: lipocalin-like domain-containing protein [Syntrophobacteraceae bacterium]
MCKKCRCDPCAAIAIMVFLALFASCPHPVFAEAADYPVVAGPCRLGFPQDHASHPDYRVEWWYYTGNLQSDEGGPFGFQLTFFRIRTLPKKAEAQWPPESSAWRTGQVFAVHAAVSDISSGKFYFGEKMSRAVLGLAGAAAGPHDGHPGAVSGEGGRFEVFVGENRAQIAPGAHTLSAKSAEFSFDLELLPQRPPVLHGDSGYSRKGEAPEEASCYYSITRLKVTGKLTAGGRERTVSGTAWMDHEFSSAPLDPRLAGWDWFSLRLSDGSDLMIYLMRERDGGISPASSGTYVDAEDNAVHLGSGDFRVKTLDAWKSPRTGTIYPSARGLEVFPAGLRIDITPNMLDQEVQSPGSARVTYWEGSVSAKGTAAGERPVSAEGYVELTGYAGALDF